MYRKYTLSSDVWSYGIVLYEIWTVGRRPYHDSWSNDYVIEKADEGYRLSPPPGCAYAIYNLMIKCWHPDRHLRPTFDQIVHDFDVGEDELLTNGPNVEAVRGILGDDVATTADLYSDLQNAYSGLSVVK
jgi:ephrin-B